MHDQAEHSALYPLVGEVLGDADVVARAALAHSRITQLIDRLVTLEGPGLVAAVAELAAAVREHVQDEEEHVLPALAERCTAPQLDALGAGFEHTKQRVG